MALQKLLPLSYYCNFYLFKEYSVLVHVKLQGGKNVQLEQK